MLEPLPWLARFWCVWCFNLCRFGRKGGMSTSSSRIPCQCLGVQYTNLLANGCLPNGSWGIAFIMSRNAFVGPITEAAKKIRPYKLLSRLCFFFVMVPLKTGNYSTIRIEKIEFIWILMLLDGWTPELCRKFPAACLKAGNLQLCPARNWHDFSSGRSSMSKPTSSASQVALVILLTGTSACCLVEMDRSWRWLVRQPGIQPMPRFSGWWGGCPCLLRGCFIGEPHLHRDPLRGWAEPAKMRVVSQAPSGYPNSQL